MATLGERHSRERIAWSVVLVSFAVFVAIAVSIPLAVNAYLHNSSEPLTILVQANQGTVSVDDESGLRRAVLGGEPVQSVEPTVKVLTDSTATGLMFFYPPGNGQLLARLQLYSNTIVELSEASAPQFEMSEAAQELVLDLDNGRISLKVPEYKSRPLLITIHTPHSVVAIREPGQYSLDATNEVTQVAVQEGFAAVTAENETLILTPSQRAEIPVASTPIGPLDAERNLIQNGSFNNLWESWVQLAWNIERANQPQGEINVVDIGNETGLHVLRRGEGHADVGIRQVINYDVTDYQSLILEVDYRIIGHTLGVCGSLGSECPLIVRIEYDDVDGNAQVWQQGFYATGIGGAQETPDVCVSCPSPRLEHHQTPLGQYAFFQANLIESLRQKGFLPPSRIKSISIFASGHGFEVELLEVALIVTELAEEVSVRR